MIKKLIILSLFVSVLFSSCSKRKVIGLIDFNNWKFKTGDSLSWADPAYIDTTWKTIDVGKDWESQGYSDYDGYAWYRITFRLPSSLEEKAFFKDSLQFILGQIDDCDETYLNGKLLGQNSKLIAATSNEALPDFSKMTGKWNVNRNYTVPTNDPRLMWDKVNVLAVRVYDSGGKGGMYSLPVTVRMKDIKDYLVFDTDSKPLQAKPDGILSKTIILKNLSPLPEMKGKLTMEITNEENKQTIAVQTFNTILKKEATVFTLSFKGDQSIRLKATYTFIETETGSKIINSQKFPYILTPKPAETPKINGTKVVGVRPDSPFLFRIPATGKRPIAFSSENLPAGLSLDSNTGVISGSLKQKGKYTVILKAVNDKGKTTRNLKITVGDRIAITPPMGWNSWNCFGLTVDEQKVKEAADIFVTSGLADHGWTYINIDDGWELPERDAKGHIVPNEKFKDMKALTSYIHSYGLKAGIYSSPGTITCGGFLGSYQHEESDAQSYADWGFDYLKYDWCSYEQIASDHSLRELQKPYYVMQSALHKTNCDIVYSLCQYGKGDVWQWGDSVGGNLWRTTGDIEDTWESMSGIGFNQNAGAPFAKPGNWNDPDMLVVGLVGWGGGPHPSRLTPSEQYTHISLWALLSAPLLIGCDLTKLDDFTMNLLTNDEVIAIDQDTLGNQAIPVVKTKDYQVIAKGLEDGSKAVGLFNLTEKQLKITVTWDVLGIKGVQKVRDVWRQKDIGVFNNAFDATVPPHGVILVTLRK